VATNTGGTPAKGTGTIVDDGTGDRFPDVLPNPDGTPQKSTGPGAGFDDDRPLTVNQIEVSESSPFAVFTVTGEPGQRVTLALESGSGTVGTDTGSALQYFDGTAWRDYTPGSVVAIPPGGKTLLVRVAIVNDTPLEGPESFRLVATNTSGAAARGTATVFDDGTNGNVFTASNNTGVPTKDIADNDTPPPPPPPPVIQAEPPRVQAAPLPPAPLPQPTVIVFPPVDVPPPVTLVLNRTITDQFVEPGRVTTFSLPANTFTHSDTGAQLTLIARQSDGSVLPPWLAFNPQTGVFQATPPPGFSGQIEIAITARDPEGREVTTIFKFNVGQGAAAPAQRDQAPAPAPAATPPRTGRLGVTDQIRLAARDTGGSLLERIMSSRAVQDQLNAERAADHKAAAVEAVKPVEAAKAAARTVEAPQV
jgi:hypothetical protein